MLALFCSYERNIDVDKGTPAKWRQRYCVSMHVPSPLRRRSWKSSAAASEPPHERAAAARERRRLHHRRSTTITTPHTPHTHHLHALIHSIVARGFSSTWRSSWICLISRRRSCARRSALKYLQRSSDTGTCTTLSRRVHNKSKCVGVYRGYRAVSMPAPTLNALLLLRHLYDSAVRFCNRSCVCVLLTLPLRLRRLDFLELLVVAVNGTGGTPKQSSRQTDARSSSHTVVQPSLGLAQYVLCLSARDLHESVPRVLGGKRLHPGKALLQG